MDVDAVQAVRDTLRGGGWRVDVLATHRPGDARKFATEALADGYDALVTYGGDGTAMQAAAALVGSELPLGLVPGGTGNLLAGNLRLPRRPDAAARAILRSRPRPIDLGAVERADGTHYFAVACGAGFDARVMARTGSADKQKWKFSAYVATMLQELPAVKNEPFRVTVDGVAHDVPAALVLIANCGELVPPFMRLGKKVQPDDGIFDVIGVQAEGVAGGLLAFLHVWRGIDVESPRVWSARGREIGVALASGPQQPMEMDGDPAGDTPFVARIVPGAVRILTPNSTSRYA